MLQFSTQKRDPEAVANISCFDLDMHTNLLAFEFVQTLLLKEKIVNVFHGTPIIIANQ